MALELVTAKRKECVFHLNAEKFFFCRNFTILTQFSNQANEERVVGASHRTYERMAVIIFSVEFKLHKLPRNLSKRRRLVRSACV